MVALRTFLVLSALVAPAYAHTRGAVNLEAEADLVAHLSQHKTEGRRLMKDKDKKVNLTGGNTKKKKDDKKKNDKNDKNRNPNNSGGTSDGYSIAEDHTCIPFEDNNVKGRASLSLSDDACRTNSCGGGCCRIYHWLICDENNEMPQLSCVCNENTRPPPTSPPTNPPTPFPTLALSTPPPTDAGAASDVKDGDGLTTPPLIVSTTEPPVPSPTEAPVAPSSGATKPPFVGGAAADSCASGSNHHNNPLFNDFTKCLSSNDCPLATECCIHSFCFCGEPDSWTGDCVSPTSDISK